MLRLFIYAFTLFFRIQQACLPYKFYPKNKGFGYDADQRALVAQMYIRCGLTDIKALDSHSRGFPLARLQSPSTSSVFRRRKPTSLFQQRASCLIWAPNRLPRCRASRWKHSNNNFKRIFLPATDAPGTWHQQWSALGTFQFQFPGSFLAAARQP